MRLAWLVTDGTRSELRQFLDAAGVDPDLKFNATPPIWRAAANENLPTVRVLLDAGADLDATNSNGTTALYIAAQLGFVKVVDTLLSQGADPNVLSTWGSTALTVAVDNGKEQISESLIEGGASTGIITEASQQSILWTAALNGNLEVVRMLLMQGAEINHTDTSGATPLYAAAANGHVDVVELLLAEVAGPDIARQDGNTPLHVAAANCSTEIVRCLLGFGASWEIRNKDNRRPLELSCVMHEEDVEDRRQIEGLLAPLIGAAREGDLGAVQIYIDMKEDLNEQVRSGKTALIYAAMNGDAPIVEILIEAGADPDVMDVFNSTALHYATLSQSPSSILSLRGSDVNHRNNDSSTPLMLAVNRADSDLMTVEVLLQIGADPNVQSKLTGDTPLHLAARFGNLEVVRALTSAGVRRSIRNADGKRPRDVIGEATNLTNEQRVQLRSALSVDAPADTQSITRSGVTNQQEFVSANIFAASKDDDDTFSTGAIVAFLVVPPIVLLLCSVAFVMHYHRRRETTDMREEKPRPVDSVSTLFPQLGKEWTDMDVDPHIQVTQRAFVPPHVHGGHRNVDVSLIPDESRGLLQVGMDARRQQLQQEASAKEWPETTRASLGGAAGDNVTVETTSLSFERAKSRFEIEETPQMVDPLKSNNPFEAESDAFKDAKDRFSVTASIVSSTQSEEFKDALEHQASSQSSGAISVFSGDEGGTFSVEQSSQTPIMLMPQSDAVESFALGSLGTTTVSRPAFTESLGLMHARSRSSELTVAPVAQSPPDALGRLESFAVQSMSDTTLSIDSSIFTPSASRELPMELQQDQRTEEGATSVQAMARMTDAPQAERLQAFALDTFGSAFSPSSAHRQFRQSTSFSFDQPMANSPPIQAHVISILSSRSSIESSGTELAAPSDNTSQPDPPSQF